MIARYATIFAAVLVAACSSTNGPEDMALDPNTAPKVAVDRFSAAAGMLFVRDASNNLPGANVAIDFDQAPFITQGFGPAGEVVRYYNFDVMPKTAAPIYVLFHANGNAVAGQLNIIDVIPGDAGYNDFWQVVKVTVPDDYVANTVSSLQQIQDAGYAMEMTDMLVNCPVVPEGSTASEGGGADGLVRGWYKSQVVFYFTFGEAALQAVATNQVPTSPIYVSFNVNPDQAGGGPASGFRAEAGTVQTHNVVATLPDDAAYSPLWDVIPYDNAAFDQVSDLQTAAAATNFGIAAVVNCPIVFIQ